ncbi:MAG: hypothetical protein WAM71_20445 [Candidatus Korobacteraceae bacterium]
MKSRQLILISLIGLFVLAGQAMAQKKDKYACSEQKPETLCNADNTCGSASNPCQVNVQKDGGSASATADVSKSKKNALFCVKAGTKVVWHSTNKNTGFVIDFGPSSPFDPPDTIIGGGKNDQTVTATRPGCFKYSVGACYSGATYGMCGNSQTEAIVLPQ